MNTKNKETFSIIGAVSSFIIFSILLVLSGLSVDSLVNMQSYLIKTMFISTAGMDTLGAVITLFSPAFLVFVALIFLVLGFTFMSSFNVFQTKRNTSILVGIIGMVSVLVMLKFSILSFFLGIAIFLSIMLGRNLSNTYFKELQKWKFFRTGSHTVSKALTITNIMLTLGVIITISFSLNVYQQSFQDDMSSVLSDMIASEVGGIYGSMSDTSPLTDAMREQAQEQMRDYIRNSVIPNSPIFNAYIIWLPIITGLSVWIMLEFLKTLILSNVSGIFSSLLIRLNEKLE